MNIFKFRIDLFRKTTTKSAKSNPLEETHGETHGETHEDAQGEVHAETHEEVHGEAHGEIHEKNIASELKKLYANGLADSKLDEFLKTKRAESGAIFQNLFSERMLKAVSKQSSCGTEYFVTIEDDFPKNDHEVICVFVKTEDDNIFRQFKIVCKELKEKCKQINIIVKNRNVTELYLYLCENDDVLHSESSIRAKLDVKDMKDPFTIFCLLSEAGIAIFFFASWIYEYVDCFNMLTVLVAVLIPLIMEIRDWISKKLVIENLSQNVKKENKKTKPSSLNGNGQEIPSNTKLTPSKKFADQDSALAPTATVQ